MRQRFVVKPIMAMSYDRAYIVKKLIQKSETISDHTIKCLVSSGTYNAKYIDGWINEIASRICESSRYTRSKNKRLKQKEYQQYLFASFGDSINDAKTNLLEFQHSPKFSDYKDFRITPELVHNLRALYDEISYVGSKMLAECKDEELDIQTVHKELTYIFRDYVVLMAF